MKEKVAQSCPSLCDPMDYSVHAILQARILECVAFLLSRGFSQPIDRTQVSHIVGRFFTSWATGKPKNSGVGSLSLLQRIFPTQESNQSLLHCRWILYQLSYENKLITQLNIALNTVIDLIMLKNSIVQELMIILFVHTFALAYMRTYKKLYIQYLAHIWIFRTSREVFGCYSHEWCIPIELMKQTASS